MVHSVDLSLRTVFHSKIAKSQSSYLKLGVSVQFLLRIKCHKLIEHYPKAADTAAWRSRKAVWLSVEMQTKSRIRPSLLSEEDEEGNFPDDDTENLPRSLDSLHNSSPPMPKQRLPDSCLESEVFWSTV